MRKKYVAGNWKMNLHYAEAMALVDAIVDHRIKHKGCRLLVAPSYIYIHEIVGRVQGTEDIYVAAQNCSEHLSGAFTGEVSAAMLASIGTDFVLIGHSERRNVFAESSELMSSKIINCLNNAMIPVLCCGEKLEERKAGKAAEIVTGQLEAAFRGLDGESVKNCVIAYEPVWAIGTGQTATPEQAQEMHAMIRKYLADKYGIKCSTEISILYGGSVTPGNASALFKCDDVDGALVGGASLKATDFIEIIKCMDHQNG